MAPAELRGGARARRVRHDRFLAHVQAHRSACDRPVECLPHAPVRHPRAPVGPGAVRAHGRRPRPAARGAALGSRLRHDHRVRRRGAGGGDRGRPAGCPVRPGVPRGGTGQEHLRDRKLRAAERRHRGAPGEGGAPDHDRLGRRRRGGLRARGRDLRHRRRGAMASRRARCDRRRGRDRGPRLVARFERRRLLRAGAHRARVAALGPVRAGDDRRADPRDRPCSSRPRCPRGDGLPDGRRRACPGGRRRGAAARAEGRRGRGRERVADAVPGRRPGGPRERAGDLGDDRAWRRVLRRDRGRRVGAGRGRPPLARGRPLRAADEHRRARVAARELEPGGRAGPGAGLSNPTTTRG